MNQITFKLIKLYLYNRIIKTIYWGLVKFKMLNFEQIYFNTPIYYLYFKFKFSKFYKKQKNKLKFAKKNLTMDCNKIYYATLKIPNCNEK